MILALEEAEFTRNGESFIAKAKLATYTYIKCESNVNIFCSGEDAMEPIGQHHVKLEVQIMRELCRVLHKYVEVELCDYMVRRGKLIDYGPDLAVLYGNKQYCFISITHMRRVSERPSYNGNHEDKVCHEKLMKDHRDIVTYRSVLQHVKGRFVEIGVEGNKCIHGYLTGVMKDYVVIDSPVYKVLFISLDELVWLVPYPEDILPYSLSYPAMQFHPISISFPHSFIELCKRLVGDLVVFDLGDHPDKVGVLVYAGSKEIKLINAGGDQVNWQWKDLKMVNIS